MKIGIFINYPPNTDMRKEGLGRYLGTLINGFIDSSNQVTIVCPIWSVDNTRKLLEDFDKKDNDYSIITYKKSPVALKIYYLLKRLGVKKPKKRHGLKKSIKEIIKGRLVNLSRRDNVFLFVIELLGWAIAAVPLLVVLLIRYIIRIFIKILNKLKVKELKNKITELIGIVANVVSDDLMQYSETRLVNMINSRMEKQDVWYVPALFWPQVNNIENKNVIINVPDLVTENFASSFSDFNDPKQTILCRKTILEGNKFITYCNYIGEELLEREFGIESGRWRAVRHSNHDLKKYIEIPKEVEKQMNVSFDLTHEFSKSVVYTLGNLSGLTDGTQLCNAEYIFYSSQWRPNKNILTLIKAYEYLIRVKFRHTKLVLTGRIYNSKEIKEYIEEHDLKNEILICHGVSMQELAALYCCAKLVVNPTLYEGGFPFTFGEGMSVGTPSIMSDIPQSREVLEEAGLEEILFDPKDYRAVADKIDWALDNVDYLYQKELPLYEKLAMRTDEVVANEYLEAFKELSI